MSPRRKPVPEEPPADWTPTQAVEDPIINTPFDEPQWHWVYTKDGRPLKNEGRRQAGYWYKTRRTGAELGLFAEEDWDDLPLVNALRADVKRWREAGYRGASAVTKELLAFWRRPDRPRPLFFCQLEAAETVIYLLEIASPGRLAASGFKNFEVDAQKLAKLLAGQKPWQELDEQFFPTLVDDPHDGSLPLRRMGCKMATGSGKTVVMAMLVAWGFCNRGRNPATTNFPSGVLVCAPNVTVKNRLQVVRPEHPDNYYDAFDLVPAKYRDLMSAGKVLVTNWHALALKNEHREGDASYRVVKKGEETPDAFTKDRLGDLASRLPILVLNDEGHHCWRPKVDPTLKGLTREEKEALEEEIEEARVWLAGLDRINNCGLMGEAIPGILACVDLSATPFYLEASGHPNGSPFPWLVSDFGLVDAIESGIVKIPRLPVLDDSAGKDDAGRPDPKYFRLWKHIRDAVGTRGQRMKPDAIYREAQGALTMLAGQWKQRYQQILADSQGETQIPPAMIVVCDNTEIAEVVFQGISGEHTEEVEENGKVVSKTVYADSEILPELANTETRKNTIRIDTKLLRKVETDEGETKDEAAEALREVVNTVGKRGGPGEQVRCVVSVGMLTEGWDATNVTHILGIRAFDSQLLCEQVVGRGLRRISYSPDPETKKLALEHVDVYGIPFSLIPFRGRTGTDPGPDVIYHHIYALPERASFEIRLPVVESYSYDVRSSGIRCDVDSLEGFRVEYEPTTVFLTEARGYQDDPTTVKGALFVEQTREEFYKTVRLQRVLFNVTQLLVEDLVQGGEGEGVERLKKNLLARHQIFPEVYRIVADYVARRVDFAEGVDRRELAHRTYVDLLRQRIRDGILPAVASDKAPLVPITNSFRPVFSTADVNYRTTRKVVRLTKSHLNLAAIYSVEGEADAIERLEDLDCVEYYTPIDRPMHWFVPYQYLERDRDYIPDFVVQLRGGLRVLLEIKGKGGELHDPDLVNAKNAAATKWVSAVNNARRWGRWEFLICRELGALGATLEKLAVPAGGAKILPFRRVERPTPAERFKICVPLTSLRAAASRWSEEQWGLDGRGEWAEEWVTFDTTTRFQPGMFVAKVIGDSMEPKIPAGSYCLFRPAPGGSRQGRILLVRHSGIDPTETGGEFTVKIYTSEKAQGADGDFHHTRIVLKPLNPKWDPIVLTPSDENDVQEIAEFVEVLG